MKASSLLRLGAVCFAVSVLGACSKSGEATQQRPPPQVGVIQVQPQSLPLTQSIVGRLAPTKVAEVRARVTGIVQKRVYKEGSHVDKGDLLFVIDPAPLKAVVDEKKAALAQAQAKAKNDAARAQRMHQLAKRGVVSKQDLEDADASKRTSQAGVAQARAALETAKLDLSYTTVEAPISGRAGRALVTVGALVSQSSGTQFTTVEQIDPLYVNFSRPLDVVKRWRKARANGEVELGEDQKITVDIVLPDGSEYAHPGTLGFTDMRVDPKTGSVSLRAVVPNPDLDLLPGTFVTLELNAGTLKHVILVPQTAVLRSGSTAYVLVVDDNNTVQRVPVHTRGMRKNDWVVDEGLSAGQSVVVDGVQRARPGTTVNPVPASSQAAPDGPAAQGSPTSPDTSTSQDKPAPATTGSAAAPPQSAI